MIDAREYCNISKSLLVIGETLPADIYLFMPKNKSLVHFRRKGEVLSIEDSQTLAKVEEKNILIHRKDKDILLQYSSKQIGQALKSGDVSHPSVQAAAAGILSQFDDPLLEASPELVATGAESREMLVKAPEMVKNILSQMSGAPSLEIYERVLKQAQDSASALENHNQQVSALAVLMLLTLGEASMDDLADMATAGLFHDVGLKGLPQVLTQKHLDCDETLNSSEKITYLRHVEISIDTLKRLYPDVRPGCLRIIEHHHEQWDGSGFRGVKGNLCFWLARVFRIADEVVCRLNSGKFQGGLKKILLEMSLIIGHAKDPLFDNQMIQRILDKI